ncbi:MAG: OmpP1/FadL family transporter [Burkholderiales bacterium]
MPLSRRALFALVLSLLPAAARGQTNERNYEDFDFHFVTPGARAAGMGRAFIGLADDATAAASNPAGLANLLRQEFSIEFIGARNRHTRFIPSEDGQTQTFGSTALTPSFLSYVIPHRRGGVSFFRHAVQDYKEDFAFQGRFIESLNDFEDGAFGTLSVQAENYGMSTAYVISELVAVGGSFSVARLNLAGDARSGSPDTRDGNLIRSNPRNGTTMAGTDLSWSGVAGVLVKPIPGVVLGATYNGGSTFHLTTRMVGTFLRTRIPGDPSTRESVDRTGDEFEVDYVAPPRYSAGASWRIGNRLTVLGDWSFVAYSRRVNENFLIVDFQDPDAGLIDDEATRRCRQPCAFYIDDVHEWHGGAEYRFYRPGFTTALRGGVFTDPDHQLRFRSGGNDPSHPADKILNFRFNTVRPKTDVGVTAGLGIALANRLQFDVAVTHSHDLTELVISTVIRPR